MRRAAGNICSMWISGPITTVHIEHICHALAAVARVGLATRRWLSETSRSAAVVLGNHPFSVRPHTANHFAAVALRSSEAEKS